MVDQGEGVPVVDRASIEAALTEFFDAFARLDWPRFRLCFLDDATVFFPTIDVRRATGRSEFEPGWRAQFERLRALATNGPPYVSLDPRDLHVQLLGDTAVVTFELPPDPARSGAGLGRRTVVLRRTPDGWKIAHLHASNVEPP
jgi:ketosteroid isomerase-like protein